MKSAWMSAYGGDSPASNDTARKNSAVSRSSSALTAAWFGWSMWHSLEEVHSEPCAALLDSRCIPGAVRGDGWYRGLPLERHRSKTRVDLLLQVLAVIVRGIEADRRGYVPVLDSVISAVMPVGSSAFSPA
jgi:hypothetical protein